MRYVGLNWKAVKEDVIGMLIQRQRLNRCCHHQDREAVEEEVNGLLGQRQGLCQCCHHCIGRWEVDHAGNAEDRNGGDHAGDAEDQDEQIMPVMQRIIRKDHAGDAEDHKERSCWLCRGSEWREIMPVMQSLRMEGWP